jgi:Tol biopolymer transport system component
LAGKKSLVGAYAHTSRPWEAPPIRPGPFSVVSGEQDAVGKGGVMQNRQRNLGRVAFRRLGGLLALLIAVAVLVGGASAAPLLTELVSVRSNGKQGNDISGRFSAPAISDDGLVVAFDSQATNLVGGDNNGAVDVFVHDRTSGRTTVVSVSSKGKLGNGTSSAPAVNADGRFVAFSSGASNLVPGDANARGDVFVHDRLTGDTTRVSVGPGSVQGDATSFAPSISTDGRFVAFTSDASNLVAGGSSGRQAFVHDRVTGATELVSVSSDGTLGNGFATPGAISGDGRFVAFGTSGNNLVPGDTNGAIDVFVHDRVTGTTERASVRTDGGEGNDASLRSSINGDGSIVTFSSDATNLVDGDTNEFRDIFVHDMVTGVTERISVGAAGVQSDGNSDGFGIRGGTSFGPEVSTDGRHVAFDSQATNLIAEDTNTCSYQGGQSFPDPGQCPDIFVRDLLTDTTVRVSVDSVGAQSNGASTDPDINGDGSVTTFFSVASNLVAEDTNTCPVFQVPGECADIFVHVETSG